MPELIELNLAEVLLEMDLQIWQSPVLLNLDSTTASCAEAFAPNSMLRMSFVYGPIAREGSKLCLNLFVWRTS